MKNVGVVLILVGVGLAGCTDGAKAGDDDGDGLSNTEESSGWLIDIETMTKRIQKAVTSDPDAADTDGDGLLDVYERTFGLDPRAADTDEDGLTDCQEVRHTSLEECENADFEGPWDGGYGTSPSLADSDASASRYVNGHPDMFSHRSRNEIGQIPRGDGISDGEEVAGYAIELPGNRTRHVVTNPLLVDSDGDGLEDAFERFDFDSDGSVYDTDGDGCEDGFDMHPSATDTYSIGLQSLTWAEPGRSGTAEVVIIGSIVDRSVNVPERFTLTVRHGEPLDLTPHAMAPVAVLSCTYPPSEPWFRIDIQIAEFRDGEYAGRIDVQSESVPNGKFSVWVNARTGAYRWTSEGPDGPAPGVIEWAGTDGSIRFEPRVILS